ncbi:MAG: calcium/sodium antiporter [Candidatus Roizmanbacteria bacterium]|nr:calcium/sodium antiporter [Candidatus Roizmanbacteria bacterium]
MVTFVLSIFSLIAIFYILALVVENHFVPSLENISQRLKLSSDISGATLMAAGSSAPELFVSFFALFRPSGEQALGAGTIVGSAIFNILVIIGASALYKKAKLTWQPVIRDLVFYSFTILLLLLTFSDGRITFLDASLFVALYGVYLLSFKQWKRLFPYEIIDTPFEDEVSTMSSRPKVLQYIERLLSRAFFNDKGIPQKHLYNFLLSVFYIAILSHFMVESAVHVAQFLNISSAVIGLTVLAAGTSIPDLLSSMHVAKRGRGDMAIANAVGSNIFDIAIGLGLPWLCILLTKPMLDVATENLLSSVFLLFATVIALLFLLIVRRWQIGRNAGLVLIALYVLYVIYQLKAIHPAL